MDIRITIVIWTILIVTTQTQTTPIHCSAAFQCSDANYTGAAPVRGGGYKSLYGATIVTTSSVQCYGAFSCYDTRGLSASSSVLCNGQNSCANGTSIQTPQQTYNGVRCSGSLSCIHSNITSYSVMCRGAYSCANSHIHNASLIYGDGAYSLQNATISSTNHSLISLDGYHAGFGAAMHCQRDHHCTIYCKANGCEMFFVQCDGRCTIHKHSNYTLPPITNLSSYNASALHVLYDANIAMNIDDACTAEQEELKFDDQSQNKNGEDILLENSQNGEHVCCRGESSCYGISDITTDDASVICSGMRACFNPQSTTIMIRSNSAIFCGGYQSCTYAQISPAHDVYCSSYDGCTDTFILNAQNVYCVGEAACKNANIASFQNMNVYLLGRESAFGAVFTCAVDYHCSILCGGFDSCRDSKLECGGSCTVQCNNDTRCPLQPTSAPTVQPSSNPSAASASPSKAPSTSPSEPTHGPSASPSDTTSFPTHNPFTPAPTMPPIRSIVAISPSYGTHQPMAGTVSTPLATLQTASSSLNGEDRAIESGNWEPSELLITTLSIISVVCVIGVCLLIVIFLIKRCKAATTAKQLQSPAILSPEVDEISQDVVSVNPVNDKRNDVAMEAVVETDEHQKEESFEIIGDDETPMDHCMDREDSLMENKMTVEGE